jgi:predicted anti-sigma-YlaC factor YlaD
MTCTQARDLLSLLLYGGLDATEAARVQSHLTTCPACRDVQAALQHISRTLDTVPAPAVQVDLPRLLRDAAALQQRRVRRWRRTAMAVCGLAAALLLVVLLRLEVRVQAHQLSVSWGAAPMVEPQAPSAETVQTVIVRHENAASPELEEQVRVARATLHALADNLDSRDVRLQERVADLETRLERMRFQDGQRWSETERSVAAIYKAVFVLPNRGERQ